MFATKVKTRLTEGTCSRHDLRVWLVLGSLLVAGLFAARQLSNLPLKLRYPGELDDVEGMRLAEMLHLRQGVRIYAPASPERFDAAIYGPLYYLLGSRLVDSKAPSFLPLRVVSVLATFGCAACCALLAFWLSHSYVAATLAPLLFLAYGLVSGHGMSARCDSLALLLCLAGFLTAYREQNSRAILLAIPLMLAGLFYKQQFIAGPLAVLLSLLLQKRLRVAAQFASLLALGVLGLLALFQFVIFPRQDFLRHFLFYNLVPFEGSRLGYGVVVFGLTLAVPLFVALQYLRASSQRLLSYYLGFAAVLSLLMFAKAGTDTNYFLECVLILSALSSVRFVQGITQSKHAPEWLLLLGLALLSAQIFQTPTPQPNDFARDRAVQDFLRRNFAPRTPALGQYAGDLVRAGLDTPISDVWQYTQLVYKGTLSDESLLAQLHDRRFGVIVLTYDLQAEQGNSTSNFLTGRLRRGVLQNYQLAATLELPGPEKWRRASDRFYAWVPRSP